MPNNFTQLQEILRRLGTLIIGARKPNMIMSGTILAGSNIDKEFAGPGETVSFLIEPEVQAYDWWPGEPNQYTDMAPDFVNIKLDNYIRVALDINIVDFTNIPEQTYKMYSTKGAEAIERKLDEKIINKLSTCKNHVVRDASLSRRSLIDLALAMDLKNIRQEGRLACIDSEAKADILDLSCITNVSESGSATALRKAQIGEAFGINFIHSLHMKNRRIPDDGTLAVNNTTGYPAGTSVIAFDGGTDSNIEACDMVQIASNWYTVVKVEWITEGESGTLTLATGLISDAADDVEITVKKPNQAMVYVPECAVLGTKAIKPYHENSVIVNTKYGSLLLTYEGSAEKGFRKLFIDFLCGIAWLDQEKATRWVNLG